MVINGFVWSHERIQHIARHNVESSEVEEILHNPYIIVRERNGKYGLCGETDTGRLLTVIIERQDNDMYRVITAYDMNKGQKALYFKHIREE